MSGLGLGVGIGLGIALWRNVPPMAQPHVEVVAFAVMIALVAAWVGSRRHSQRQSQFQIQQQQQEMAQLQEQLQKQQQAQSQSLHLHLSGPAETGAPRSGVALPASVEALETTAALAGSVRGSADRVASVDLETALQPARI